MKWFRIGDTEFIVHKSDLWFSDFTTFKYKGVWYIADRSTIIKEDKSEEIRTTIAPMKVVEDDIIADWDNPVYESTTGIELKDAIKTFMNI